MGKMEGADPFVESERRLSLKNETRRDTDATDERRANMERLGAEVVFRTASARNFGCR